MTTMTMKAPRVTMKLHRHRDGQNLGIDTLLVTMRMLYVSRRDILELDLPARTPTVHLSAEFPLPSQEFL